MPDKDRENSAYVFMDNADVKDFYEKTRQQITHEDLLINYRFTWLLAINAFLFTLYAISLNAEAAKLSDNFLIFIRLTIASIGLSSSLSLWIAFFAAIRSMYYLVKKWDNLINAKTKHNDDLRYKYPQIIGNKDYGKFKIFHGLIPAYILPGIFLLVWTIIGVESITVRHKINGKENTSTPQSQHIKHKTTFTVESYEDY